MSVAESRAERNGNRVRIFSRMDMVTSVATQKWDVVKVSHFFFFFFAVSISVTGNLNMDLETCVLGCVQSTIQQKITLRTFFYIFCGKR